MNTFLFEMYRPNAEPMTPGQYDYTIHSFTCPACLRGLQRPKVNLSLAFDRWIYWCEICDSRGTRADPKWCAVCRDAQAV